MPINGGRFIIPLLRNSRSMLNLHGTLCEKKKVCSLSPHLHKKPEKCFHPPLNPHKISNHKDTIMGPKKSSYMNKNVKFNLMRSEKKKNASSYINRGYKLTIMKSEEKPLHKQK